MNKKAQGESFSTIKNAILVLIVLAVVISVFYILLKDPIAKLRDIGRDTTGEGDEAVTKINNLLGKCEDDEVRCSLGKQVECNEGKWEVIGDCEEE